jgi:uncharacterized protein (TIGR03790 family)
MKRKTFSLIIICFSMMSGFAQLPDYDDVGVIVNMNSQASQDIAAYFKQARNIPDINIIPIQTVTHEAIDTVEFRNIQYQIKNYILENNLENTLRYLVTTKGVPYNIEVDSCTIGGAGATIWYCSALESELPFLLTADSVRILSKYYALNPYYGSHEHHDSDTSGLLLVSRLDGENPQAVYNLIDRSGPNTYVNKELAKIIFDISYVSDTLIFNLFAQKFYPAIDTLTNRGWNAYFHDDIEVPLNETNVFGYIGFVQSGFEGQLNYTWEKGSYSELLISQAGFTFYDSLYGAYRPMFSEMLAEGCTSGAGHVHPYFASQATDFAILFGRYTEERDSPFNLAESYHMATMALSRGSLLVGDPKTTITTQSGSSVKDFGSISNFNVYPNPARDEITVVFSDSQSGTLTLSVVDQIGNTIMSNHIISDIGRNSIQTNVAEIPSGFYFLQLQDQERGLRTTKKLIISR